LPAIEARLLRKASAIGIAIWRAVATKAAGGNVEVSVVVGVVHVAGLLVSLLWKALEGLLLL
jgi:hypothetical protein